MASHLTDDLILSHRLIKRRYVQIPKDQKAHLDDNAWSESLNRGQHPMLNIPAGVLQDVKDLHTRNSAKCTESAASSPKRPSSSHSVRSSPRLSLHEVPTSSPQEEEDDDDDEEPLPWSQSPVHHLRAQNDYRLPSSSARQPPSPNKSPLKGKDPPRFLDHEPQSSSVNSVGLEIETPGFVSQVLEPPVNRTATRVIATASAKPEPTPPSAQLPIATGERASAPPLAKRRRVMDNVHDPGDDLPPLEPVVTIDPSQRPNTSNQNSLTTTTSASSAPLNTQIARGSANKSSEPKVMSDPAPVRSFTPTYEGRRQATAARHLVIAGSPTPGTSFAPPPAQRDNSNKALSYAPKPSQHNGESPQASPSTSFETFKRAYPDYSGSSRDFTTALLMVKTRQRDRILHEILYDDFIRAYTTDYFVYVSECSRRHFKNILRDIEWYNENVQDLLYTKKVVRKDNLAEFLDAHAAEAHYIRRSLLDVQSNTSTEDESDEDMNDAPLEAEGYESEAMELDRENENQASPELSIESPGPIQGSSWRRSQLPLDIEGLTGTAHAAEHVEQMEKHEHNLASREDVQEPLIEAVTPAGTSRPSREVHTESPRAAKVTPALEGYHAARAHESSAPGSVKSFASQEISRDSFGQIPPSSSGSLKPSSARNHATGQKGAPIVSPLHGAGRSVSSNDSRALLAVDDDSDDEDAFESPLPPMRSAATPSSSKMSRPVSTGRDADSNNVAYRSSLPTAAAPSSINKFSHSVVDDEEEDEDKDVEHQDSVVAQPPSKGIQSVHVVKETLRSSSATERRTTSSRMPAPTAPKPCAPFSSSAMGPPRLDGRAPTASSVILGAERRHSAGSSIASSTKGSGLKKRLRETPEQRSQRLKAFMEAQMEKKKRLSSGTPSSTFASRG